MTTLYLVRHGETVLNSLKVYYGRTDCALSQKGLIQAKKLKDNLKEYHFDTIISSPLKRCIQTAKIITDKPEVELVLENDLVELDFGLWEGLHYLEISQTYPKVWKEWTEDWRSATPPNGESFTQMYNRVEKALNNIIKTHQDKNVLIVTHKGCLQIIASILLGGDDNLFWNFTFEHGRYSVLQINDGHCLIKNINA